jgi:hypothetical protein
MNSEYVKDSKFLDIYPKEWKKEIKVDDCTILQYRNLEHFKYHMKNIVQRTDMKCGVSYKKALKDMLTGVPVIDVDNYEVIKNSVKNNLLKRGLISETVYESYKYDVQGDIVDVAKIIAEDPNCCLVPNESYKNYFYELYINVSYGGGVEDSNVRDSISKILATVELLEREHIYIKITLLDTSLYVNDGSGKNHLLTIIPLFSHRDIKNIRTMSSVLNERLLRKFMFALSEDYYGDDLSGGYGEPKALTHAINCYNIDEVELASSIINQVVQGGTR